MSQSKFVRKVKFRYLKLMRHFLTTYSHLRFQLEQESLIQQRQQRQILNREKNIERLYGKIRHCQIKPPFLQQFYQPVKCSEQCRLSYQRYLMERKKRGRDIFQAYFVRKQTVERQRKYYQLVSSEIEKQYYFFNHRKDMRAVFADLFRWAGIRHYSSQHRSMLLEIIERDHFSACRQRRHQLSLLHQEIKNPPPLKQVLVNHQLKYHLRSQNEMERSVEYQLKFWRFSVGDFSEMARKHFEIGFSIVGTFKPLVLRLPPPFDNQAGNIAQHFLTALLPVNNFGISGPTITRKILNLRKLIPALDSGKTISSKIHEENMFIKNYSALKKTAISLKKLFTIDSTETERSLPIRCCDIAFQLTGTPDYEGPESIFEVKYFIHKFRNNAYWKPALIQAYCYEILWNKPCYLLDLKHGNIVRPVRVVHPPKVIGSRIVR